jgi:hypothetical protein
MQGPLLEKNLTKRNQCIRRQYYPQVSKNLKKHTLLRLIPFRQKKGHNGLVQCGNASTTKHKTTRGKRTSIIFFKIFLSEPKYHNQIKNRCKRTWKEIQSADSENCTQSLKQLLWRKLYSIPNLLYTSTSQL